jgi:hypothetical protein
MNIDRARPLYSGSEARGDTDERERKRELTNSFFRE